MFDIFTAFPRGYCAGVHRAVDMLLQVIADYPDEKIYVNHEIIHNTYVIALFERKGVIFESDVTKIPEGALVVISAHGTGPSYFSLLRSKKIRWVDATCPLVEKVHKEAREYIQKGYHIIYIGKKGHQEALGVIDEGEKYFTLIEKEGDIEKITHTGTTSLALLTQTTLAVDDTQKLIEDIQKRFPEVVLPKATDICYATTNRQMAVKALAQRCDTIFVVGSKSSSNSAKLRDVAEKSGARAFLIDRASEIEGCLPRDVKIVGVTAGASGPENLVEDALSTLKEMGGVFQEELRVKDEHITFPFTLTISS